MSTVYLDTNIVINAGYFLDGAQQSFLKACALVGVRVVIPEVVVDEVHGNYEKKLSEAAAEFKTKKKVLLKLVDLEIEALDVDATVTGFKSWFKALLDEFGVVVVPYPKVTAKELVTKSYEKAKPFKSTGEGHKDYLVWESIKSDMSTKGVAAPFIFVSHNTADFSEKSDTGDIVLHAELVAQLAQLGTECTYYTSLKTAFDGELAPHLENIPLGGIEGLLEQIDSFTETVLENELIGRTAYGFAGLSFGNDVSISYIEEYTIASRKLYKLGEDLMIEVSGEVIIEVDGFVDKFSYYSDEDGPAFSVTDGNWNDHVMAVCQSIDTPFELTAVYELDDKSFESHSFVLPDEIEDEWPYK